jgi:hypothetical protein
VAFFLLRCGQLETPKTHEYYTNIKNACGAKLVLFFSMDCMSVLLTAVTKQDLSLGTAQQFGKRIISSKEKTIVE